MTVRHFIGFSALLSVAALVAAGWGGVAWAQSASFDCGKAKLAAETAICGDPKLAAMDALIAKAFKTFQPEFGDKRKIGRGLIADRNACGGDVACLAAVEVNAIETYGEPVDWATQYLSGLMAGKAAAHGAKVAAGALEPVPAVIGACAATRIDERGTRFSETIAEEDDGEGSRVGFANGLSLVSYEHVHEIVDSRIGDPVVTCLISTPRDCPAGDDRGKSYFSLNLRSKGSWMFGDSQHMCGGA